jgi:hypothetical protein
MRVSKGGVCRCDVSFGPVEEAVDEREVCCIVRIVRRRFGQRDGFKGNRIVAQQLASNGRVEVGEVLGQEYRAQALGGIFPPIEPPSVLERVGGRVGPRQEFGQQEKCTLFVVARLVPIRRLGALERLDHVIAGGVVVVERKRNGRPRGDGPHRKKRCRRKFAGESRECEGRARIAVVHELPGIRDHRARRESAQGGRAGQIDDRPSPVAAMGSREIGRSKHGLEFCHLAGQCCNQVIVALGCARGSQRERKLFEGGAVRLVRDRSDTAFVGHAGRAETGAAPIEPWIGSGKRTFLRVHILRSDSA